MTTVKDIPPIPEGLDPDLRRTLQRIREELQSLLGLRGDPRDAALRLRSGGSGGSSTTIIVPGTGGGGGDTPDLTPPPTVSDLAIFPGFSQVILTWSGVTYTEGRGNKHTLIYAVKRDPASTAPLPTFGDAQVVATATHPLTIISLPSELNTQWHVWAKFETNDGVLSVSPAGGTNGVTGTTGQDIEQLLEILTNQITASQLYIDIGTPINSIADSIDEAAAAALANILSTYQESKTRAADLLAEAVDRGAAITLANVVRQAGDEQLAQRIVTLTAAVNAGDSTLAAALQQEELARATADEAEALQRTTLAAQLRGGYTGADLSLVTSGLLFEERSARVTADGAQVTRISGLESSVNTPSTGLLARATVLEATTTNATSGNAALATRALNLESKVNDPTTGVAATALALDVVETLVNSGTQGNAALASRTTALEATVNNATTGVSATAAALDVVELTVNNGTSGNAALATRTSGLEVAVNSPTTLNNPTYARLLTEESTRAALDGSVAALYTLRAEVSSGGRTVVGGFGLSATATATAGPRIDFGVRADQFWIAAPAGSGAPDSKPFIVRTTTSTEGGVTVPAGVYMDAAFIVNLSALYARIATLIADQIVAADISVAQLTTGTLRVGADMSSTGFVTGTSGWRIRGNGDVEFSNATVRGLIYASGGTFAGALVAATGTFAGSLSAATGTFAGQLRVGSSPTISGTTMTGTGAVINADGTFALGTPDGNITYNGTGAPVLNGLGTIVASLSTYAVAFNADSTGLIDAGQSFPVVGKVQRSTTDETSLWTFSVSSKSDASITTSVSTSTVTISGMGTGIDSGWVEIQATRSGSPTQGPLRVNVAKIKRATPSTGPNSSSGYTLATRIATGTDAVAEFRLNSNGKVQQRINGGTWTDVAEWFKGTVSGSFSGFAEIESGDALTGGTLGVWQSLGTTRTWTQAQIPISPAGERQTRVLVSIRNDGTNELVATVSRILHAIYEA